MNRWVFAVAVVWLWSHPATTWAQQVEIAPAGGYRFGGGFFERVTNQDVDLDGAPAIGGVLKIAMHDGSTQFQPRMNTEPHGTSSVLIRVSVAYPDLKPTTDAISDSSTAGSAGLVT